MKLFLALVAIAMSAGTGSAAHLWVNNITVNEYNMTWSYTETFTGADSIAYRVSIDSGLGNNDSFVSAWELLNADREMRKSLKSAIDKELDVRINNGTGGVEVLDVDSTLSPEAIGKTHSMDAIVNMYNVTYGFKESILNASSIWFLGQANSPVTIVMPPGVDVVNSSGMNNASKNVANHSEITGLFKGMTMDRGELTLYLAKNTSYRVPEINVSSNVTSPVPTENLTENFTKSAKEVTSKVRNATIIIAVFVIIVLIYVFKVKRR
jgi:hypothetical protein